MWDWTNAGAVDNDFDKADFGDRRLLDGSIAHCIGFFFRRTRSQGGMIWGEVDNSLLLGVGCVVKIGVDKITVNHNVANSVLSPAIAVDTLYSYLIVWNTGAGLLIYRNGVLWHTDAAFLTVPTVPKGIGTTIGADLGGLLRGPSGQLGNVAVWPRTAMNAPDAVMWHNGIMPHRGGVRFFHRCVELPGKDEYARQVPDCYRYDISTDPTRLPKLFHDDVSLYTSTSDDYFPLHGETMHAGMQTIAGEELHRRRLIKKGYQMTVPTEFLAKDLGDDLQLTHKGGLECTGEGFGYGDAPERLVRIEKMALDPEDRMVDLTMRDVKRHCVSYYNAFRAPYTITGRQLGVHQLLPPHAAKETIRASYSWGQDLAEVYQEYGLDQEPLTGRGLLVESKAQNIFANATFKFQLTSWNSIDPGLGTISVEASNLAFDSSITGYSIKLTCGTPFAGNSVSINQVVAGAGVGKIMTLSFIYYAETADTIQVNITRASDGWYLQDVSGPFAAPVVGCFPPIETAYKGPRRYTFPYDFDGNDNYTIFFFSSGVDGKIIWIYHAQFEEGKFATGPVTNESGNGIVRLGSIIQLRNPDDLLLPKVRGTIAFEFEPLWDHDEGTGNKFIMRLDHDTDNRITLYWDAVTSKLICNFKLNAVAHLSEFASPTWSAGDTIKIAIRWLDDGELGKPSAQGQLFAKFGSGAWQEALPIVFSEVLQGVVESFLYVGGYGGTIDEHQAADGYIRYLHCFPEALPFEEIQALLGDPP